MRDEIKRSLESHIRRVYPVVRGLGRWGNLADQRDRYFSTEFPLIQEPLIEAIPQYQPGEGATPDEFTQNAESKEEEERLNGLGQLLKQSGVNYSLYAHQMESILAHLRDKDVVVATGTGSGKTEAFLFPMMNHLHDEALRCKEAEEQKPSERAVKCLMLYPMNALVADQLSRLRALLGNPEISTMLLRKGYGRFPQFGMYTGRTDYHGWFAKDKNADNDEEEEEEWERNKRTEAISSYLNKLAKLRERKAAWDALISKYKIPSIGGKVVLDLDADEEITLCWNELSVRVQQHFLRESKAKKYRDSLKEGRFRILPDKEKKQFERFLSSDYPSPGDEGDSDLSDANMVHVGRLGDGLDRELIGRYQMHLGGVRQYLGQKYDDARADHCVERLGVGIPDVMVTNYSMLEYMLMRPLEHTFWHSTKEWLRGCDLEGNDPMRRKLLLVVDEAHLYKGAMGTEFSLLLNRLLNVLEIDRNRIQFIITSASLGEDEGAKKQYVSGLLSLNSDKDRERREAIAMPESTIMNVPNEDELELVNSFVKETEITFDEWEKETHSKISEDLVQSLIAVVSDAREHEANQEETERNGLIVLFGEERITRLEREYREAGQTVSLQQQVTYDCVTTWPLAYRLKRLLLNPNGDVYPLTQEEREELTSLYDGIEINGDADDNFPRRYEILKAYLFEEPNTACSNDALDLILDIIASARPYTKKEETWKGGKSFLPLRMHLLARGDNIPVICPGCGGMFPEGTAVCRNDDCNGVNQFRTYQLHIDRNCGGVYLMLWCEANKRVHDDNPLINDPSLFRERTFKLDEHLEGFCRAHQRTSIEDGGSPPWFGMLAHPIEEESIEGLEQEGAKDVYCLGLRTGRMVKHIHLADEEPFNEDSIYVHLPNRRRKKGGADDTIVEKPRKFKPWEMKGRFTHHIQCRYCRRDFTHQNYTNQYSNLQTRGNEFFLNAISTMNAGLDAVKESEHYPHQGRKTLIFTDSRQGAARLATKFKTDSSIDEGRAFFTALHSVEWFTRISDLDKSVGGLYPYMCIFAGQKRMNPLNDSEDLGRTRMLIHTASLATYFAIKYPGETGTQELLDKKFENKDKEVRTNNYIRKLLKREATYQRSKILRETVWKSDDEQEIKNKKAKEYKDQFKQHVLDYIEDFEDLIPKLKAMNPLDAKEFLFDDEQWGDDLDEIITGDGNLDYDFRPHMEGQIKNLQSIVQNEDLITSCLFSDLVLEDTEDGHIKLSKQIHDGLAQAVVDGAISLDDFVSGVNEWDNKVRPMLGAFSKIPDVLGGLILRWASDTLFSLPILGLGSFKSLILEEHRTMILEQDEIEEEHLDQFLKVLPWTTSDFSPLEGLAGSHDKRTKGERAWLGGLITKTSRYRSYGGSLSYSEPLKLDDVENYFGDSLQGWIRDRFGDGTPETTNLRRVSEYIRGIETIQNQLIKPNPAQEGDQITCWLNANSLVFEPYRENLHLCITCLLPKPPALREAICLTNGCSDTRTMQVDGGDNEANVYYKERLEVWKKGADRLINPEQVPRIYRAEEHTAQNSEKLNKDDLFSSTQLYELMFQDIPVTSNKIEGKDGADIEHPPIDILSCSTTMEVGIDIGGLTSVALRNVPPHPANYQQRVGRAGRGSSEVSVALTWVDNTAFATSYFVRPEGLVTSPKKAPQIYVDNRVIRTRHLNAILLQRFFKDENLHPYNPSTLTFRNEGGGAAAGLLDSLGTYNEFIGNEIPTFGLEDFTNWCGELTTEISEAVIQGTNIDELSVHITSLINAMNLDKNNASLEYLIAGINALLEQITPGGEGDE